MIRQGTLMDKALSLLPQDGWALLGVGLVLFLRQSPAEAALTAIGLRIALDRIHRMVSRLI